MAFVVLKSTQGLDYVNPYFASDTELAHEAGLLVGALHYAEPGALDPGDVDKDSTAQALFARQQLVETPVELGVTLDLGESGAVPLYSLSEWTAVFASTVAEVGHKVTVRINPEWLSQVSGATARHRLWLAAPPPPGQVLPGDVRPFMESNEVDDVRGVVGPAQRVSILVPRSVNPAGGTVAPSRDDVDNGGDPV